MSASAKDGRALISLTNLEADVAQTVEIDLRGGDFAIAQSRILTAARLQDHNTTEQPAAVAPQAFDGVDRNGQRLTVELPAHSFVTVELEVRTAD
jgi:alpha-N-arabinofuranosidase